MSGMFPGANDMVKCPYNESHMMLRKKLQSHLMRCRKNYQDIELQTCPFNSTHLITEENFVHHVTHCTDRKIITHYKYNAPVVDENSRPKQAPIETEEDWNDTEVEDYNPVNCAVNVLQGTPTVWQSLNQTSFAFEGKQLGDDCENHDIASGSSTARGGRNRTQSTKMNYRSRSRSPLQNRIKEENGEYPTSSRGRNFYN